MVVERAGEGLLKRIAMFGGTFNPIHLGHLHLAKTFADALNLDKVLLIPSRIPPHKLAPDLVDGEHRLAMCRLAAKVDPRFQVSDVELRRTGPSYTYDTLQTLKGWYPGDELYLITGSDMFLTLEEWHRGEELIHQAILCAGARNAGEMQQLQHQQERLEAKGARCCLLSLEPLPLSSTLVRQTVAQGKSIDTMVPKEVDRYIQEHGLYHSKGGNPSMMDTLQLEQLLKNRLSTYRFTHSINVSREAARLARLYGGDEEKARLAGLLHDICKELPVEEQLQWVKKSAIIFDNLLYRQPQVLHGPAAAEYLRQELDIQDEDLLNAVRYHTVGRSGMSLLEKIVYVADLTSADRDYRGVDQVRQWTDEDLDKGLLEGLKFSLEKLLARGKTILPCTVAAYNECLLQLEQKGA